MKKIFAFIALLFLLVACKPEPAPVVQPLVQTIVQPSETIDKIEIKSGVQAANVDIKDFSFQPAELKVKVGDTVVWTQHDSVKHNVEIISGPETFKSELLDAGQTFSYTFTKPGEYSYKCTPHPKMRGKVIVE